ncbi:unnamed protein product [Oikopleura dioica]|uniref:Uncharacterized protein n=1 Tax=Oikopleura dioica TaxID=34765 RepID=E4YQN9_OIKDI|nr:unnamed protein product [Oikopleura dioica]
MFFIEFFGFLGWRSGFLCGIAVVFLAAGFLAAGFLAAGFFAAGFLAAGFSTLGLAAGFSAFLILNEPEAPMPLVWTRVPFSTPDLSAFLRKWDPLSTPS